MTDKDKARVDQIVETMGCSLAEAIDMVEYDKQVDKARVKDRLEHDLPIEVEKQAKKMCNVKEHAKKQTAYKFDQRPRKENTTKKNIVTDLEEFLHEKGYSKIEVLNAERQLGFSVGDKRFEVTLVEKRKPKAI